MSCPGSDGWGKSGHCRPRRVVFKQVPIRNYSGAYASLQLADPSADIAALANLPNDKVRALADMIDESIIVRRPDRTKVDEIVGTGLSETEFYCITNVFYNFVVNKASPQTITRMIDATPLTEDKKTMLQQVLKNMHERLDAQKMEQMKTMADLKVAGHPHLHQLSIYTELRPISNDGRITKMIPKLIVNGVLREPYTSNDRPISIQLDPTQARRLSKEVSNQLDALDTEIRFIREKMGDDMID